MIRKLIGKILGTSADKSGKSSSAKSAPGKSGNAKSVGPRADGEGPPRRRRKRRSSGKGQATAGDSKPSQGGNRESPRSRSEGSSGGGRDGERREGRSRNRRRRSRKPGDDRRDRGPSDRREEREKAPAETRDEPVETAPVSFEPAPPVEIPPISDDNEFVGLGLEPFIVAATESMGYLLPTPIQSEAIPYVLQGRDVIGSAQTGTGKTAAFGLPILQKLKEHGPTRCLILEPTRELASQVDDAFKTFCKYTNLRAAVVYGGVGYGPQLDAFKAGIDIVVATPGRLLDHLGQGNLSLNNIEYLVLDEVDRMLDMGFLPDVKKIIAMCPKERQTLFFSATIPPELEKLTEWVLSDPHTIEIGRRQSAAETVTHAFYPVIEQQKFALLLEILEQTHYESVLIFCRTKHGADFVANRLEAQEHKVAVMHSNRTQRERTEALAGFKSGKYEVLVATDVAARGLDIAGVTHVINYDTPLHPEDYVHRIGRTGRAQAEGDAFTLLTEEESKYAYAIERVIGKKVERKKIENFPYQYSAVFEQLEGEKPNVFRSRLYRGTRR